MTFSIHISLTTIPPRFEKIENTLKSLLNQTVNIKKIWLNIPKKYRRFPNWDGVLPKVPKGVTIHRINEDFGPATKLIPTLKENTNPTDYILYCDDDWEYHPNWAKSFLLNRYKEKSAIAASTFKVERLGSKNGTVLQGFGGVLVRNKFFTEKDLLIEEPFTWVDDIWFSACLCKNKIRILKNKYASTLYHSSINDKHALQDACFNNLRRADFNKIASHKATEKFGIWF